MIIDTNKLTYLIKSIYYQDQFIEYDRDDCFKAFNNLKYSKLSAQRNLYMVKQIEFLMSNYAKILRAIPYDHRSQPAVELLKIKRKNFLTRYNNQLKIFKSQHNKKETINND